LKKEIEFYSITDPGIKRTNNEDSLLVDEKSYLFIVADGMGGHSSGEIASSIAVESIVDFFKNSTLSEDSTWPYSYDDNLSFIGNKLKTAISVANDKIQDYSQSHTESRGMGTTVVAIHKSGDKIYLAHVGDSRCYLLRDNDLSLLTSDHSWVNEQVRLGVLTESDAQHHPFRNVITRALGTKAEALPEVKEMVSKKGDLYLLCSDGLNSMVLDDEIKAVLASGKTLEEMGKTLVEKANQNGGEDNISLILLRILS
jgi:protein phosphatase